MRRKGKRKGVKLGVSTAVVMPGEGRSVWLGGMGVVFKVSGAETGGAFAIVEHPIEPGRLVLPHVHLHEDEYSYVLEGTIGARVGDHEVTAGPGSYVIKPRGLMHTFWNAGSDPDRLLEVISPAGFEAYFAELAAAGDPGRRDELSAKYGVTYSSDWVARLISKYNLKLLGH
jgi:quercetin dioxygenase-like cupin family protein